MILMNDWNDIGAIPVTATEETYEAEHKVFGVITVETNGLGLEVFVPVADRYVRRSNLLHWRYPTTEKTQPEALSRGECPLN